MIPMRIAAAWLRSPLLAAALLAIALVWWAVCPRPDPVRHSPAVVTRAESAVVRHQVATAVDTAAIRQLREQAARALAARLRAERGAAAARVLADSLAAVARLQGDAAQEWRGAYDARTEERDSLQVALARTDTALVRTDSALSLSERARVRGDSVLAAALTAMRTLERTPDRRGWVERLRPKLCAGPAVQLQPSGRITAGLSLGACWTLP